MPELVVQQLDPRTLKPHPLNKQIYGKHRVYDADFVESIREHGVRDAVRATRSLTIISGHDRTAVAIMTERATVPVIVESDELDDLEIRRDLILCNLHRPKTKEQRGREVAELESIEAGLAKQRQKLGGSKLTHPEEAGRAMEKAAKAVGMSKNTAKKAKAVVKAIDQAEAAGDTAKAAELRDALENKSIEAAHRKATGSDSATMKAETATETPAGVDALGVAIPRRLEKAFAARIRFAAVKSLFRQIKAELNKLAELPGGEVLKDRRQQIDIDLANTRRGWSDGEPYCVCPQCKASGQPCDACDKRGWITEDSYKRNFKKADAAGKA